MPFTTLQDFSVAIHVECPLLPSLIMLRIALSHLKKIVEMDPIERVLFCVFALCLAKEVEQKSASDEHNGHELNCLVRPPSEDHQNESVALQIENAAAPLAFQRGVVREERAFVTDRSRCKLRIHVHPKAKRYKDIRWVPFDTHVCWRHTLRKTVTYQ